MSFALLDSWTVKVHGSLGVNMNEEHTSSLGVKVFNQATRIGTILYLCHPQSEDDRLRLCK